MSFWNLSDGNTATETTGTMEMGGGDIPPIPPIPANTELLAAIDEAKMDSYEDDSFISLRWSVMAPEEYKNRKIFQKVRVFDNDAQKADKAKRMLMAIDHNCGGKLAASGEAPDDSNMQMSLIAKPMMIKVQIWEMNDKKGNWVSSVAARKTAQTPAPTMTAAPVASVNPSDDVPFQAITKRRLHRAQQKKESKQMEQRSPEWFKARKNKITGSVVGAILGQSPFMKPADVMRNMVREYHGLPREFAGNVATDYGTANEQTATIALEMFHLSAPVVETGFHVHPDLEWLGASPDGLLREDGIVEIKCPYGQRDKNPPVFKSLLEMPHYYAQTQIEMFCTGRKWVAFYQWSPNGDKYEEFYLDQKWLDDNIPKLKAFYDSYLIEREMPNAQRYLEPKHKETTDKLVVDLVDEFSEISDQIKALEIAKKDLLKEIIERCGERQSEINGHKLTKVERKGSIDYSKVPVLKDIDLEQYRKEPTTYWSLK